MTREEKIKKFKRNMTDRYGYYCVSDAVVNDIIDETIEWADEQPKNHWRDAITDTPIDAEDVLCRNESGTKRVGFYSKRNKIWYLYGWGIEEVKHWMPIPELPKKTEE